MIKLTNVKKQYKQFCLDCSMEVQTGQITGLIGRNGAGKSTLFKAALGLLEIDGGKVEVLGKDIGTITAKDREQIGVVFADSGFSGYLCINDVIAMLSAWYTTFSAERFKESCQKMELPLNKKIKEFSTGMKRKLQILAAISHNAKLLILDEPTAGLDVVARNELLEMLRVYMEDGQKSIVISSHISSDLEGLCDEVYMIEAGKMILHEDTDVLLDEYGLIKATPEQYERLDKSYIIKDKKERFGYSCLTNCRQFYQENYPGLVVELGSIDEVIEMMSV